MAAGTPANTVRRAAMMLLAMMLTTMTAWADSSDTYWQFSDADGGTCTITGNTLLDYQKASTHDLTIPKTLGGKTVSGISWDALSGFTTLATIRFYQDASIKNMPSVMNNSTFFEVDLINDAGQAVMANSLPNSITDIGTALRGTGIRYLTMPGVTSIGEHAFADCKDLEILTMPEVTSVSNHAFDGCDNLGLIQFGKRATIGENVFSKLSYYLIINYSGPMSDWVLAQYQYSPNINIICTDGTLGWCGDQWNNTPYQDDCLYWTLNANGLLAIDCVPNVFESYGSKQVVKTIPYKNEEIKSITLNRVYGIESDLFFKSTNLTSVFANSGLVMIGEGAFYNCSKALCFLLQ